MGQTYAVTFIMVDWSSSAVEPQAVERYITIAPSCPLGEEMCAGGLCSPLPCSMLADLTAGQEEEAAEPLPVGTAIRLVGARSLKVRRCDLHGPASTDTCPTGPLHVRRFDTWRHHRANARPAV